MYRNMQRSFVEFQLFADHLAYGNPQSKSIRHITLRNIDLSQSCSHPACVTLTSDFRYYR